MSNDDVLLLFRETIWTMLKLASPLLLASMTIGLIVSIFQAATQINEQTLTFVPKLFMISFLLIVMGSWLLTNMTEFFHYLITVMSQL